MPDPAAGSRRLAFLPAAVCAAFILGRLWVLLLAPVEGSTVGVFAEMAWEYRAASAKGESFHDLHARRAREKAEAARARGGPPGDPAKETIEYPPLAVAWIVLPTYIVPAGDHDAYRRAFRLLNALADAATFLFVWWMARRMRLDPWRPLLLYALCGLALFPVLYDRLDLVMALLVAGALALLVSRAHWLLAFAALAVAMNFKLVPLLLAPAFVIGAMPGRRPSALALLVARSAVMGALCGLVFLPFWLAWGRDALGFLAYHAERGVQVESIPANLLLLAGQVSALSYTHGAIDVISPAARATAMVSTAATIILLAAVSLWMIVRARRPDAAAADADRTFAQARPREVILFVTLLLWSAMLASKVFSPQYMVWLLPLAPLVLRTWISRLLFMLACAFTTVIFPYHYFSDIARARGFELLPPSGTGVMLLTLRNAVMIALLLGVALRTLGAATKPGVSRQI